MGEEAVSGDQEVLEDLILDLVDQEVMMDIVVIVLALRGCLTIEQKVGVEEEELGATIHKATETGTEVKGQKMKVKETLMRTSKQFSSFQTFLPICQIPTHFSMRLKSLELSQE